MLEYVGICNILICNFWDEYLQTNRTGRNLLFRAKHSDLPGVIEYRIFFSANQCKLSQMCGKFQKENAVYITTGVAGVGT